MTAPIIKHRLNLLLSYKPLKSITCSSPHSQAYPPNSMSSSSWRQPTVEDDWEPCVSETPNKSTTPPPKYSSLQVVDNTETGNSNALGQEIIQEQREMDLENGQFRPTKPALSWYGEIYNCISVRKLYNRIPFRQIFDYMTLENILKFFGTVMLCLICVTTTVVCAVLAWDLVVFVVVNRTKSCSKSDWTTWVTLWFMVYIAIHARTWH